MIGSLTRIESRRAMAGPVRISAAVIWLSSLIAALALVAAATGLLSRGGDGAVSFTTLWGETVELYGRGIYRHDTLFKAGANRGADMVTLVLAVPLLVLTTLLYRRGSVRGALLLIGTLVWFLYVYASVALGTAYNDLFLLSIALFSAALFAFVTAFASIDLRALSAHIAPSLPRRGVAAFMIVSGLATLGIWLGPLLGALNQGSPPAMLESYTTTVTDVLDLGVITPAAVLAGVLLLRRAPLGYVIALSLLVLEVLLAPMIATQTAFQVAAGVTFTVGPIVGFTLLSLTAAWVLLTLLRAIPGQTPGDSG